MSHWPKQIQNNGTCMLIVVNESDLTLVHTSMYMLPWTSDRNFLGNPLLRWSPSQFWETTCFTFIQWKRWEKKINKDLWTEKQFRYPSAPLTLTFDRKILYIHNKNKMFLPHTKVYTCSYFCNSLKKLIFHSLKKWKLGFPINTNLFYANFIF